MVLGLRLHAPNTGDMGSIPGQGTRSHMLQLRVCMLQLNILHAAMKIGDPTCHNQDPAQPNKYFFKKKKGGTKMSPICKI